MGIILKNESFRTDVNTTIGPVILCNPSKNDLENAVSLNVLLAERIITVRPRRRSVMIENCFLDVLEELQTDVWLKDFDVVFNPEYQIDVLSMLISINKKKHLQLIWPGRYDQGKLYYSEEGYLDYKTYFIDNYDLTCII